MKEWREEWAGERHGRKCGGIKKMKGVEGELE